MGLLQSGKCPLGSVHGVPVVWKVLIWVKKNIFCSQKKPFCVSMGPFTQENGPREGSSGPTKRFFLIKNKGFF